jgi:hypothetical protein
MKARANWLAWFLHGVFGLVAGVVAGLVVLSRGRAGLWLDIDLLPKFLIGTALMGAGLGSRYGDRLWLGDNYRMLPPEEPEQSNFSDWLSWGLVAAGCANCIVTVLRQLEIL